MISQPSFTSLVAPNIFDAYANPNLLLYLVASNLLSPATWELSEKIQARAAKSAETAEAGAPSGRLLIEEIQRLLDRSFKHLHVTQVAELYGAFDLSSERQRLGSASVDEALKQIRDRLEARIRAGSLPAEAMQPILAQMGEGRFPAYTYGNIDLIRANRRLMRSSHTSVRGLTSCVDEIAIFAALAMTVRKGVVANVIALSCPAHTTAFGWTSDGTPWWFYGKNRIFFPDDWQRAAAETPGGAQALFDGLLADMNRITSVAGTFDLETGRTNLPGEHIEEIAAQMDAFFGVRLRQVDEALARSRAPLPQDPLADYLRALLGTTSRDAAQDVLASATHEASEGVLYAFRSLAVKDMRPYLEVARSQPNSRTLASTLSSLGEALDLMRAIDGGTSIFGSRGRIAMPDETLRFRLGTDRDKALLLHVLLEDLGPRVGLPGPVATGFGETSSFVRVADFCFDVGAGAPVPEPCEPLVLELA